MAGFQKRLETNPRRAQDLREKAEYESRPKRKRAKGAPPLEREEQRMLMRWLREQGIDFDANLEGAQRSWGQRIAARANGMKRGRPDIEITTPVPGRPDIRGVAIEFKRQKPYDSAVTDEQREKLAQLRRNGWVAEVCYGAEHAKVWLMSLGFGR
jgi:hypothetical protein